MGGVSLSQVLLTDDRWRYRLAATVPEACFGVEWAAGRGSLTVLLTEKWNYGLALELDFDYCKQLRRKLKPDEFGVVRADLTNYPPPSRAQAYPIVGNLPYHLTGPLLMKLGRNASTFSPFLGLLQWEVAQRITAQPGRAEFRSISLIIQCYFKVDLLEQVPPEAFTPEPEVESGWVRLIPRERTRPFEAISELADLCFRQPRKTLLNNLSRALGNKDRWKEWMELKGWDPHRRPHSLTVEEFLEVYDRWSRESS